MGTLIKGFGKQLGKTFSILFKNTSATRELNYHKGGWESEKKGMTVPSLKQGEENHFLEFVFTTSPYLTEQLGPFSPANEVTLLRVVPAIMKNNISGRTQYKIIVFHVSISSLVHKLGVSVTFPTT